MTKPHNWEEEPRSLGDAGGCAGEGDGRTGRQRLSETEGRGRGRQRGRLGDSVLLDSPEPVCPSGAAELSSSPFRSGRNGDGDARTLMKVELYIDG